MDDSVQIEANDMEIKRKEDQVRPAASGYTFMRFPYVDDPVQIGAHDMDIKRKHKLRGSENPTRNHQIRPLRWGLAFLWALGGQCCVGGICDSKIKEMWWFTMKITVASQYTCISFACLDRLVQITTNQMNILRN